MAQFIKIRDLAARKQALLAESELYRQTLKLELQNVQLYGARFRRKFSFLKVANQLVFVLPLVRSVWAWRSSSKKPERKPVVRGGSTLGLLLTGWRIYRNLVPVVRGLLSRQSSRSSFAASDERTPAANI